MVGSVKLRSARRLAVAAPLIATQLAGCTTWKTQTVQAPAPTHVRLVMVEGSMVHLYQARVVADSMVGFSNFNGTIRKTVPLARVKEVQTQEFLAWRSAFLVVGGTVGLLLTFYFFHGSAD